MKIVVTGSGGLIGWHACARLHSLQCAAKFKKQPSPFELVTLNHARFEDKATLANAVKGADAVLHFAGVNRAADDVVEAANPQIANTLVEACQSVGADPHIVYANSTHAASDTPYGRSKRIAGEILGAAVSSYTNLILPHIFGECARPYYNNVTATLIDQVLKGEQPTVNPDGRVQLLHAGQAAQIAIDSVFNNVTGDITPEHRPISIPDLLEKILHFHTNYLENKFPDLTDDFDLALFNSYRAAAYPDGFPRELKLNTDPRGTLFEASKSLGGGGQTFLSWTEPGVTRGDHFHLGKVERFLVISGEAVIRIRKVLSDEVWEYHVSGDRPAAVDMPTLHTHSLENVGEEKLLTLFWTHDLFDPNAPDTFADPVLRN